MSERKKLLPPGPRAWFPTTVVKELRKDPLAFLTNLTKTYGDISTFKTPGQRYVILNHPDLVREVCLTQADAFWKGPALQNSKGILGDGLLTAEGTAHKSQRKLMQGAFHAKHVEKYGPEILERGRDLVAAWRRDADEMAGGTRDVRLDMMGLTLVIAGKTLFGSILADEIATVARCMDDVMNNYVRAVVPWGKLLNYLPTKTTLKLARARNDMRALVDRMIAARRKELAALPLGSVAPRDLLSTMIASTDAELEGCPVPGHGVRLTDDQLRDQSITILTAGHETTANAMTFTLYLLAMHPEEQKLLREEVTAVLGQRTEPTIEMLDALPRTRWVLSESMRLLPPAWTLGRQNQRPMELGGFHLPKKCTILVPQWTLHRDPRFWNEPLAFMPERWRNPTHPRYAYFPFSTGPRNCIGESFAWLEMLLLLPMLIRQFTFALPPNPPDLRLIPAITLRPRDPVRLLVRPAIDATKGNHA